MCLTFKIPSRRVHWGFPPPGQWLWICWRLLNIKSQQCELSLLFWLRWWVILPPSSVALPFGHQGDVCLNHAGLHQQTTPRDPDFKGSSHEPSHQKGVTIPSPQTLAQGKPQSIQEESTRWPQHLWRHRQQDPQPWHIPQQLKHPPSPGWGSACHFPLSSWSLWECSQPRSDRAMGQCQSGHSGELHQPCNGGPHVPTQQMCSPPDGWGEGECEGMGCRAGVPWVE